MPEKMTCMEDSKWAIAVRAVAVLHVVAALEILVKWRWNTLTQRFLQVVRNTKKSPVTGVKLQVHQQKKRKLRRRTHRTMEKWPCAPLTLRSVRRRRSRWNVKQGDSSAVWGQLHHGRSQKLRVRHSSTENRVQSPRGFPIMEYRPLERIMEGGEHGRRKKAFHQRGS